MSEPMTDERVAAVVVTYNRKALLQQCLEALLQQTHPLTTIIVVDNASTDGTTAMLAESFPAVEVIRLAENRGGAGGFHAGMRAALDRAVDWIWVMDDDAEPALDALGQLFATGVHRKGDTVALSSLKVDAEGSPQTDHVGSYDPCRMQFSFAQLSGQPITRIEYSSFVGLLVSVTAVRQVGLPEEGFFIWYDDVEYCLRLAQIGKLYLVEESMICHHDAFASDRKKAGALSKAWRDRPLNQFWRNYYAHRNRVIIVTKHAPTLRQRWRGYAVGVKNIVRSAAAVIVFDRQKAVRLRLLLKALIHGLKGKRGRHIDPDSFR